MSDNHSNNHSRPTTSAARESEIHRSRRAATTSSLYSSYNKFLLNTEVAEHQDSDASDRDNSGNDGKIHNNGRNFHHEGDEELEDNNFMNSAPFGPRISEHAVSLDQSAWTPRGSSDADSTFTQSLAAQQIDVPASDPPPQRPLPPIPPAQPPTRSSGRRLVEYGNIPLPSIPKNSHNRSRFARPDFSGVTGQDSYPMESYGGNTPENESGPESCANLSFFRADGSIHSLSISEAESRELRAHIRRQLDGKRREIRAQNSPAGSRINATLGSGLGSSQRCSSFGLESSSSHNGSGQYRTRTQAGARPIPARGARGDEDNDEDGDWETVEESANRSQRLLPRMGTHYEDRSSIADTSYEGSLTPSVTPDLRHRYHHPTPLSSYHTHPFTTSPPILSSRDSPPSKSSSFAASEHSELPTNGSYGKMTVLGTHGNITRTPNGTGKRRAVSSLADYSSQGFERSEVSTASNELRAADFGRAPRLQTRGHATTDSHLADLLTSLQSFPVVRPTTQSLTQDSRVSLPPNTHEVSPHLNPLPRLPTYLHDTRQALLSRLWLWGLLVPFPFLLLMGHGLWDGVLAWQTGGDVTCVRRREKHLALALGYGLALCWALGMVVWMVVRYG